MKPRLSQSSRVRAPRIDPQPFQNERDDERLIQPVELPDGNDDSDEEEVDGEQPAEPMQEELRHLVRRDDELHPVNHQQPNAIKFVEGTLSILFHHRLMLTKGMKTGAP